MNNTSQKTTKSKPFTIPGVNVTVERNTDILTLIAFFLAVISIVIQIHNYFLGASVTLIPPEQILLRFVPTSDLDDERHYLTIAARMAYVNSGNQGYGAVIRRESVSFRMGEREYVQRWHSEQKITDLDNNGKLEVTHVDEARPRPIGAGSALSREMLFVPFPKWCADNTKCDVDENYYFKETGVDEIMKQKTMTFVFSYELFGDSKPVSVKCVIDIDERVNKDLEERYWTAPPCLSQ